MLELERELRADATSDAGISRQRVPVPRPPSPPRHPSRSPLPAKRRGPARRPGIPAPRAPGLPMKPAPRALGSRRLRRRSAARPARAPRPPAVARPGAAGARDPAPRRLAARHTRRTDGGERPAARGRAGDGRGPRPGSGAARTRDELAARSGAEYASEPPARAYESEPEGAAHAPSAAASAAAAHASPEAASAATDPAREAVAAFELAREEARADAAVAEPPPYVRDEPASEPVAEPPPYVRDEPAPEAVPAPLRREAPAAVEHPPRAPARRRWLWWIVAPLLIAGGLADGAADLPAETTRPRARARHPARPRVSRSTWISAVPGTRSSRCRVRGRPPTSDPRPISATASSAPRSCCGPPLTRRCRAVVARGDRRRNRLGAGARRARRQRQAAVRERRPGLVDRGHSQRCAAHRSAPAQRAARDRGRAARDAGGRPDRLGARRDDRRGRLRRGPFDTRRNVRLYAVRKRAERSASFRGAMTSRPGAIHSRRGSSS